MHGVFIFKAAAAGLAHDNGNILNKDVVEWLRKHSGVQMTTNAVHVPERYWTLRIWTYHTNTRDRDLLLEFSHKSTAALFKLTWL